MRRRGSNQVSDFLSSFNQTYGLVNKIGEDYEMGKVAAAKPEQSVGFTAEQGKDLEAAATRGDTVHYDDANKSYVVSPQMPEGQAGPAMPRAVAQQGVTDFMGQRTAGSMNEDQIGAARMRAMAGVKSKYDPEAGLKMMREVKQSERDDQRWTFDKARGEREMKLNAEQDADREVMRGIEKDTGEWFSQRLANPDGTQRAATIDDHLASSQMRASKLMAAGKTEAAGNVLKDASAQSLVKIQLQSAERTEAIGTTAAALAAGDLGAVKNFYNKFIPDGANVTDVQRGAGGQLVIQRETADGRKLPPQTLKDTGQMLAALTSFKDPMALYNWSQNEFKNNLTLKADARADRAEGRAAMMAGATLGDRAEAKGEKRAKADAAVELFKEKNPNATEAQLSAVKYGILKAVPEVDGNAPAQVKLAHAFIRAGLAKDEASALRMATQNNDKSPQAVRADVYGKALAANMGNAAAAKTATDEAMAYLYPAQPDAATAQPPGRSASGKVGVAPPAISTREDFQKLPKGTQYTAPDGTVRTKQ